MPRPAHTRMTWKGGYGEVSAPVEEWQFSLLSLTPLGSEGTLALTSVANNLFDMWATHLRPVLPNYCSLQQAEVRAIGADGLEPRNSFGAFSKQGFSSSLPLAGSVGGTIYPPQVAVVASLVTPRAGATGKGRFFLPGTAYAVTKDTMTLTETSRDTIRTAVVAFINGVNSSGLPVAVLSSYGYGTSVTGVKVGRTLDTQRSRRRSLTEGYGAVAAVTSPTPN